MFLFIVFLAGSVWGVCPIQSDTTVVYYGGNGAAKDCQMWEDQFWSWWALADPRVKHVKISAPQLHLQCDLTEFPNLKVYVQPGGNAYDQTKSVGDKGKANILKFIQKKQGIYLGTCAGWYFAADSYIWQGQNWTYPDLLHIYEEVEGSITDIWDFDKPPGFAATPVAVPGSNGTTEEYTMLYFGGPTRGWRDTPNTVNGEVLLEYTKPSIAAKHMPAAVQDGNLLLFSVHAEAHEDGQPPIPITVAQREANYRFRAAAINKAAGTNWKIPPAKEPTNEAVFEGYPHAFSQTPHKTEL